MVVIVWKWMTPIIVNVVLDTLEEIAMITYVNKTHVEMVELVCQQTQK